MKAWWTQPMRAVTLEFPASDVATIDVEGIVDECQHGGVNTLCVFAIGYYPGGTAFYQSKIAPHYPGLGQRDLVAETIEAARKNGQKVIAYVAAIWGNRDMFFAHPDWAQRKADGSVTTWDSMYSSVAMDPMSPYRDYLASVVREIGENYDVDGFYFDEAAFQSWSASEACKTAFKAEYGVELPTEEKWDDPVFQKFIDWRYRQITKWRTELYDLVKTENRCVFFQGAFPLATLPSEPVKIFGHTYPHRYQERFGVFWHVPMAHATHLPDTADIGDILHFELYRRSVREPLWWYGVSLRYGQAIARGKQILTLSMMAHTPFELYGMADAELRVSTAELLANGSAPLFARYYPDRVDQDAWNKVYDLLKEAQTLEPYLTDRQSVKYAAILFSQTTQERFDYVSGKPPHLGEMKGFAKALLHDHILFDIITEDDLADQLKHYRVLILPNTSCLSPEAKQAVRDFVSAGGGVVASYETGMYDKTGCRTPGDDLAALFGVAYDEQAPDFQGFDVYMQIRGDHGLPLNIPAGKQVPTGGQQIGVMAAGAHTAAGVMSGSGVMYGRLGDEAKIPGVLHHIYGKGRVVFFAPPLGNRYLDFGVLDHRILITDAVRWAAAGQPPIRLENTPQTMALTAFDQRETKRTIIHLVNSVRDEVFQPIAEVPESRELKVIIDKPQPPGKVSVLAGSADCSWQMNGSELHIMLPSVQYYAVIVVED